MRLGLGLGLGLAPACSRCLERWPRAAGPRSPSRAAADARRRWRGARPSAAPGTRGRGRPRRVGAAWSPVSRSTCAGRRCAGRRCAGRRGQGKGWSGVGLMRACHTCRSRCVSGSGCLGPLPPPVPPAPLLLPPPLPAPAPLLPLPLPPPLLPPLPRPPPAFSGEALRASGGGGGGGSRLRVVVRSLHPSQPRHLHQEPESASTPRTRDRRSREHAQGRWRGARAQC